MKTFILADGTIAKLGDNSKENWELLSDKEIKPDYYWFHLSSYPSGHLVLLSDKINIDLLQECYTICKVHSKYKNHRNLKVDCTQIKNLKKTEKQGEVEYKSNKKVKILDFRELLPYTRHKTFDINSKSSQSKNNFHSNEGNKLQKFLKNSS
jgi:predicted ribosome quality control (RQC) complex YloA/Tae2 family protein